MSAWRDYAIRPTSEQAKKTASSIRRYFRENDEDTKVRVIRKHSKIIGQDMYVIQVDKD